VALVIEVDRVHPGKPIVALVKPRALHLSGETPLLGGSACIAS
jgi:hypothetical protein